MFTRNSAPEPSKPSARPNGPAIAPVQKHRTGPTDSGDKSIIGNDLRIIGQGGLKIISRGILQIDGEIEGDVQAAEVIIGAQGKVTGLVAGQQVTVSGKVSGAICARTVTLQSTSEVEGDIHHMAFAIEQGAVLEGRSRRAGNETDLNAGSQSKGVGTPSACRGATARRGYMPRTGKGVAILAASEPVKLQTEVANFVERPPLRHDRRGPFSLDDAE